MEKLERAQAVALEGLQDSVISIEPTTISLQTKFTKEGEGDPATATYVFRLSFTRTNERYHMQ